MTIGLNPCKINSDTQWLHGKRALVTEHPHCLHFSFFFWQSNLCKFSVASLSIWQTKTVSNLFFFKGSLEENSLIFKESVYLICHVKDERGSMIKLSKWYSPEEELLKKQKNTHQQPPMLTDINQLFRSLCKRTQQLLLGKPDSPMKCYFRFNFIETGTELTLQMNSLSRLSFKITTRIAQASSRPRADTHS